MLFDTHAHLDHEEFDSDRKELLKKIKDAKVGAIINVGTSLKSSLASVKLAKKYDFIFAAVGVHPYESKDMTWNLLEQLRGIAVWDKVVAIGEIGLDYYRNYSEKDEQRYWFKAQLDLAKQLNKPVIIHSRDSMSDCLSILRDRNKESVKGDANGVVHCFSGSLEQAQVLINLGFYISFTGIITFSNSSELREVVKFISLDNILIETDCPYLAPVPHRGERNYSGYVGHIANEIAQIKGVTFEEVASVTFSNAQKLFGIRDII